MASNPATRSGPPTISTRAHAERSTGHQEDAGTMRGPALHVSPCSVPAMAWRRTRFGHSDVRCARFGRQRDAPRRSSSRDEDVGGRAPPFGSIPCGRRGPADRRFGTRV